MSFLTFKVVVVGEPQMGKTTLVQTIQSNRAPETGYKATIGVNYVTSTTTVGKRQVTLQLWDIAGQERLVKNLRMYYEHAYLALIVVSVEKIEKILSGESSIEKQIEFFRTTDYVVPNSSKAIPLCLVISKWDMAEKYGNPEELKKRLSEYGKSRGFEFTSFTTVFEPDINSVRSLRDQIVESCLKLSSSQTLRAQFLGSIKSIEKLAKMLKPDYDSGSLTDSLKAGQISIPLGVIPAIGKDMTIDARPNNIPKKAPLYSEPNIVGAAIVLSSEDFIDKASGIEIVQRTIDYLNDTREMKIHNYDNYMRKCIIYLDDCIKKIGAKETAILNGFKNVESITLNSTNASSLKSFLSNMAKEWNNIFEEEQYDDCDDEIDLDILTDPSEHEVSRQKKCGCGHN